MPREKVLLRLIEKKSAFQCQQGVLVSSDAGKLKLLLSVAGAGYEEILKKYYTDVELLKVY